MRISSSCARDPQILALLQQQLLVDQVAQDILLLIGENAVRITRVLLLNLLLELVAAAHVLRTRDDAVVDAGNDLLDDGVRGEDYGKQGGECCQQKGQSGSIH